MFIVDSHMPETKISVLTKNWGFGTGSGRNEEMKKLGNLFLPLFPFLLYTLFTSFLFINWLEFETNVFLSVGC